MTDIIPRSPNLLNEGRPIRLKLLPQRSRHAALLHLELLVQGIDDTLDPEVGEVLRRRPACARSSCNDCIAKVESHAFCGCADHHCGRSEAVRIVSPYSFVDVLACNAVQASPRHQMRHVAA